MRSGDFLRPFRGGPVAGSRLNLLVYLVIPLVSLTLHIHVFSRDLVGFHVWRQSQTQINIDNFASEDFNILNPRINDRGDGDGIVRMEFPLMQWVFALFFRLLGADLLWSRILSFLIGLISVFGFFHLLRQIFRDHRLAALGAWAFCFSPVFFYYTVNPMSDNLALCASIWGMAFFFRYIRSGAIADAALSAAALGVATLAKLPFVLCLSGVAAHFILEAISRGQDRRREIALPAAIFALFHIPAGVWYAAAIPHWGGNGIVMGIIDNRFPAGELLNIARFTALSTLPELLINYGSVLFFITGTVLIFHRRLYGRTGFMILASWGIALILYFLFEMNMIRYVHDYYLLPFLPPIFIIVFSGIRRLVSSDSGWVRTTAMAFLVLLPLLAFLRINHRWNLESPGFNRDLLVYKDDLRNAVPDDALCVVGNDESRHIYFYHLHKKGWGFDNDRLDRGQLDAMIRRGARYLYTDSRGMVENERLRPLIGSLVLERGSFSVYRLQTAPDRPE